MKHNIFFIADLHIGHKNILKHQSNRVKCMNLSDENDIVNHDEYIIKTWLNQTKRGDIIYVLGDFIMSDTEITRKILHRLKSKGVKIHLIIGNHDKNVVKFPNMFESMSLIKEVSFKKGEFPFLKETLNVVMCHYPILSWNKKSHGSLCLHGHTHDNSPWENETSDLRINVGFDTELSNYELIPLEKIYEKYLNKLNGKTPQEYIDYITATDKNFVR